MRILTKPHRLSPRFPSLQILPLGKSAPVPWEGPSRIVPPRSFTHFFLSQHLFYPGAPILCFVLTKEANNTFGFSLSPSPSGDQEQNVLLALYVEKVRLGKPIPNPSTHPPACPVSQSRRPPTLKCATPPPSTPPAAKLHNAQCVTASQSASQRQWSARARPGHTAIRAVQKIWYLEEPCNVTLTAHTCYAATPPPFSPMTYVTQPTYIPVQRQE